MDWRYLTDCKYFLENRCENPQCTFRHPAVTSNKPCYKWMSYQCYNVNCRFLHPSTMEHGSNAHASSSSGTHTRGNNNIVLASEGKDELKPKSQTICRFYVLGKCKAMKACPYLHDFPEAVYKRHPTEDKPSDREIHEADQEDKPGQKSQDIWISTDHEERAASITSGDVEASTIDRNRSDEGASTSDLSAQDVLEKYSFTTHLKRIHGEQFEDATVHKKRRNQQTVA